MGVVRTKRRQMRRKVDDSLRADSWAPSEAELKILSVIRRIPRRARLVGRVLSASPLADGVPWHRVVNAAGRISLRGGEGPLNPVGT